MGTKTGIICSRPLSCDPLTPIANYNVDFEPFYSEYCLSKLLTGYITQRTQCTQVLEGVNGSNNGLLHVRCRAILRTSADLLSTGALGIKV